MYSVVLMAALAGTTANPNFGRCHGCSCSTPVYNSCAYSWGYAVPTGCGCHGCYATPIAGYGAAGGCYGYHGGCYSGWGMTYGDPYYGGCTGCYGCYGGYACYGVPLPGSQTPAARPAPAKDPYPAINPAPKKDGEEEVAPPKEKVKKKTNLEEGKKTEMPTRAIVRIEVPVGGKLFVDGNHIKTAAGTRSFQTPALKQGETYFYDIRIEIHHDGVIAADERRVVIQPGQDVAVDFPSLRARATTTARGY